LLIRQIEISVFLTFLNKKTAKERWHSLVSRMGEREEYLETPFPLPLSPYGRTLGRTLTSQPNFLGLIGYQFFLPMVLRWRASPAEVPLLQRSAKPFHSVLNSVAK